MEIPFQGTPFTWSNQRHGNFRIEERLDRIFLTSSRHITVSTSGHKGLMLYTDGNQEHLVYPFGFEAFWIMEPYFRHVVEVSWRTNSLGSPSYVLLAKLWDLQKILYQWNRIEVGNLDFRLKDLRHQLDFHHSIPFKLRNSHWYSHEQFLLASVKRTTGQIEKLWEQKARLRWVQFGDANTRYFHITTTQRRSRNRISSLSHGLVSAYRLALPEKDTKFGEKFGIFLLLLKLVLSYGNYSWERLHFLHFSSKEVLTWLTNAHFVILL
ncbi:uncharacterized protein LOC122071411 [Macadamia integrifolia]|uniref:uncharacterized protein LOC122071411 n=1 Tax=Macadamia integrifolia TaxID=60698 RepID=UPI001C4FEAE8|nr:uncharacterized protein LOC122071411 [Macadamia integrifolia]